MVTASIPRPLAGDGDLLKRKLTALLKRRSDEVQAKRPRVEIEETPSNDQQVRVTVNGRPLALLTADVDRDSCSRVDAIVQTVDRHLRWRLSVLSDDPYSPAGYLVDHGFAAPRASTPVEGDDPAKSIEERGEWLMSGRSSSLKLSVSEETLRNAAGARPADLMDLRLRLARERGVQLPDVRLVPSSAPVGTVQVRLNDIHLSRVVLPEPAWGDVVSHLEGVVTGSAHWFVNHDDVSTAVTRLSFVLPDLVETLRECFPDQGLVTACVRGFVRDNWPSRNLSRLLWLLLEAGGASIGSRNVRLSEVPLLAAAHYTPEPQTDPVVLMSRIRKCVAEESWRVGVALFPDLVRVPERIEARLLESERNGGRDAGASHKAAWDAIDELERLMRGRPSTTVVVSDIGAIRAFQNLAHALPRRPRIIAEQELPPDVSC
jgi:hypothetical protein